jgi:protein-L-isoaspartate O-methyltransferase
MQATARELADKVVAARRKAWEKSNPTVAVVSTEQLNPEDEATVQRIVAAEGYTGAELDEMVRKVSGLIVGRVEALADDMPADNAD